MRTETVVLYTLAMVLCTVAIILTACKRANYGALLSSIVVLLLVVSLTVSSSGSQGGDVVVMPLEPTEPHATSARRSISLLPPPKSRVSAANQVADVPNNAYLRPSLPSAPVALPPPKKLVLPIQMEGQCNRVDPMVNSVPNCGGGYNIVPNMPPMPGLAQPPAQPNVPGEVVWRLPEYPVAQSSREETIAAVVSDLPTCCQQTPKEVLRNQGLYGIKGNLSCDLLKRSAVSDHGFLEPLAARNAFLAYNSYDQLHAKDPFLIPVNKKQPE